MKINNAKNINGIIYVYNLENELLFMKHGELLGYTKETISLSHDDVIYVLNQSGNIVGNDFLNKIEV